MRLDSERASFLMFSGAMYVQINKAVHRDFVAKHFDDVTDQESLVQRARLDMGKLKYDLLNQDDIDFLLLTCHERDHFEKFFGSALGLLIYRCYLTLTVTLNWLFANFFIPGRLADEPLGRPFIEWIRSDADAWIRQAAARGLIPLPPAEASDPPQAIRMAGRLAYVQKVALPELLVLSDFLDALLNRPEAMTMGKFATLANSAATHLQLRCDVAISCKWATNFPDEPLHPDWDSILSTTELFEISALGVEKIALEACDAPEHAIEEWSNEYAIDPYSRGLHLAERSGAPLSMLGELAGIALRSPCDLVACPDGELLVEVAHPTWRFRNFYFQLGDLRDCPRTGRTRVERIKQFLSVKAGQSGLLGVERLLCENAPMAVMPRMVDIPTDRLNSPFVGDGARLFPEADQQTSLHAGHAIADMFDIFRAGMMAGYDPIAMQAIRERLVYYEDEAAFPDITGERSIVTAMTTHLSCMTGYMHLVNLFDGLEATDLPPWGRAFFVRLRRLSTSQDLSSFEEKLSLRQIATELFGAPYAKAMGFAAAI